MMKTKFVISLVVGLFAAAIFMVISNLLNPVEVDGVSSMQEYALWQNWVLFKTIFLSFGIVLSFLLLSFVSKLKVLFAMIPGLLVFISETVFSVLYYSTFPNPTTCLDICIVPPSLNLIFLILVNGLIALFFFLGGYFMISIFNKFKTN